MTKQDIYDIIQLLDDHFQKNGLEVRDEVTFKFYNTQGEFTTYDNENLFYQSFFDDDGYFDREEKVDSIKDNLVLAYDMNSLYKNLTNVEDQLNQEVKIANFNLKVFKCLSQEFKVNSWDKEDDEIFFIIQDSEKQNENIHIKKFNQF